MKYAFFSAFIVLATCGVTALAVQPEGKAEHKNAPAISGAALGEWTMDFDAAKKLAAEKNKPLFINFTGSDWCGWCKLMDRNVFAKPEWQAYAKANLVLVWIDFPNDETLVPVELAPRNQALSKEFDVKGYPTYIVLESDGKTRLGRLGASREATPESFVREVRKLELQRPGELKKWLTEAEIAEMETIKKAKDTAHAALEAGFEKLRTTYEATMKKAYEAKQAADEALEKAEENVKAEAEKVAAAAKAEFDQILEKVQAEAAELQNPFLEAEAKLNALFDKALNASEAKK